MGIVWIRRCGKASWTNSDNAVLPVTDRGFQYGDGLFETLRIYKGEIWAVDQHLDRLWNSQLALGFGLSRAVFDEIRSAVAKVSRNNHIQEDGVAKVMISRGEGARGYTPPVPCDPTIVVQANAYQPLNETIYQKGYTAILCSGPVFSGAASSQYKTLSSFDKVMARMEVASAGVDEGVLVNERGQITEATSSNLFVVLRDRIKTSPVSCGLLPGVTRRYVVDLLREEGFSVVEEPVGLDDLRAAEDVWITNSILGIIRLRSIRDFFQGQLSEEYQQVRELYRNFTQS